MTDRVKGLTVVLDHDIRIDDMEYILNAIRMVKGVSHVEPCIANADDFIIEQRLKDKIRKNAYKFIEDNL